MGAYCVAIFTGAFLLFQVQPLVGKYLLPWFGGAPAVWTTCMLVFQVLLLGGYFYAHLSRKRLSPRSQIGLHLALLAAALCTLPIVPADSWKPTDGSDPTSRIVALLLVSLGLPYAVLAATAPLLQHWFTLTHPGRSPFRLYALSNLGSLIALLTYPSVFEPMFARQTQAAIWGFGLVIYTVACGGAAWRLWRAAPAAADSKAADSGPPGLWRRASWLLLPACACALLLAVTNKTSQDVAVVPLLWILPLSLYLLSFIICFERPAWYHRPFFGAALFLSLGLVASLITNRLILSAPAQILACNVALFVCCMVCHGEVYRLRPAPARLTSFYLHLATGGALGGAWVALAAPALFSDYFELQFALVLSAMLFLAVWFLETRPFRKLGRMTVLWSTALAALGLVAFLLLQDARRYASVRIYRGRNFYGVLNVLRHDHRDPTLSLVEMLHGQVSHGMQFLHPDRAALPTLYYSAESGVGQAFNLLGPESRHVGIVGLGVGTIAAYARPGDRFRFYEINPQVEYAARTCFSFLRNAPAETSVVLGDARLRLENEPPQNFDLLVLDAFSSDAIPLHLLTREAFAVYERHLKPRGLIAVHISNRSVNLEPVLLVLAQATGMHPSIVEHQPAPGQWWMLPSTWVLLTRDPDLLNTETSRLRARPPVPARFTPTLWTDDFAALFPVLRWDEFFGVRAPGADASALAGANLAKLGDVAAAINRYREAVRLNPDSPESLNNLACLLATAPDPKLRNGPEAVHLAEKACELTGSSHPIMLSTLAAAYAQSGRFADAVAAAEKACRLAEAQADAELLSRTKHFLELYRQREVYPYPNRLRASTPPLP